MIETAIITWVALVAPEAGTASVFDVASNHGTQVACARRVLDDNALVAAHRTLPCGSKVTVLNLDNLQSVDVEIIDRGPYIKGRVIDLSRAAARAIHLPDLGPVAITKK